MQVLSRFALDVNGKSGRGTQYRLQNRNVVPFTVDIQVDNTDNINNTRDIPTFSSEGCEEALLGGGLE